MFGLLNLQHLRLGLYGAGGGPGQLHRDLHLVVRGVVAGPGEGQLPQPLVQLLIAGVISQGSGATTKVPPAKVSGAAGGGKTELVFGFEFLGVQRDAGGDA